jgi:hypothetical protein
VNSVFVVPNIGKIHQIATAVAKKASKLYQQGSAACI